MLMESRQVGCRVWFIHTNPFEPQTATLLTGEARARR